MVPHFALTKGAKSRQYTRTNESNTYIEFSQHQRFCALAMIPLRDNIPSRTTPFVNYTMIAICAVAFVFQLLDESSPPGTLVEKFGMIPVRVLHPEKPVMLQELVMTERGPQLEPRQAEPSPVPAWLTLLTCIFLHGGWLHFLGNMWFLFIFGDNVEDRVGHIGYVLFYLGCGVVASVSHLLTDPNSAIPTIGASGAIAGVMGAYFLLYPRARVLSIIPLFYIIQIAELPAPLFLGIWFLLQLLQGTMSLSGTATGVAWWAHIGGFAIGFVVALILRSVGETKAPVEERIHKVQWGHRHHDDSDRRPW